jgi:Zn-dependent protease with chaperone function
MNEDRAARYHRLRRRAAVASTLASVAWLAGLQITGASAALAARAMGFGRVAGVLLFILALALGCEIVSLPFVFYRAFLLERKYGLSSEPLSTWLGDHVKALGLGLTLTILAGVAVFAALGAAGDLWWLVAAGLFAVAALLLSRVAPVLLMPLFYRFRPLDRDALRERLLTLSRRVGVAVLGAYEWGLGEKTTRANAALVGVGRTRRILVSDTLLKDYSDDEIEVILAHELAHHVHHDIWTALAVETLVVTAALYAAHAAAVGAGLNPGAGGAGMLGALPLMILAAGGVSFLLKPIANAWSRHNERRADRFALALTRRPAEFISAMRRLGAQNLAEERPSAPVLWFFHTHPTIDERIAAAKEFRAA